jgi:peptide-methionine (S)-S-oxide reductase
MKTIISGLLVITAFLGLQACAQSNKTNLKDKNTKNIDMTNTETITLGSGCFWCTEAIYQRLEGVVKVTSGYSGGHIENPTYEQVCDKTTGHAEVCQIHFNESLISFEEILKVFFFIHDPTSLNRQGDDVGTQYRSVVFYHDVPQKDKTQRIIDKLSQEKVYSRAIVTEVSSFTSFYPAESYHQDYFAQNGTEPYCQMVVKPKFEKFEKAFRQVLK